MSPNLNGEKIFDYEEVGVITKDMSFDDYLQLRILALFVESLHNGKPFNEFFLYAKNYNIQSATFLKILIDNIKNAAPEIQNLVNEFVGETKSELWDSEEKLVEHYKKDEHYAELSIAYLKFKSISHRKYAMKLLDEKQYDEKIEFSDDILFGGKKGRHNSRREWKDLGWNHRVVPRCCCSPHHPHIAEDKLILLQNGYVINRALIQNVAQMYLS